MTESTANLLTEAELSVTSPAQAKMMELFQQVEDDIQGIRVYATPGGCSGISFGMTFTDQVNGNDGVLECEGFKVVVDENTMQYLKGVEIDFVDRGDGAASFVFNNLQPIGDAGAAGGSSCGSCSSSQGSGSGSGSGSGGGCS